MATAGAIHKGTEATNPPAAAAGAVQAATAPGQGRRSSRAEAAKSAAARYFAQPGEITRPHWRPRGVGNPAFYPVSARSPSAPALSGRAETAAGPFSLLGR